MIRFACGTCKERLAVPARYAGRRGRCPACGAVNLVPTASEFSEPIPDPVMVRPGRMSSAAQSDARGTSAAAAANLMSPDEAHPPVAWSMPVAAAQAPLPEVAPLPEDIPPGEMVLVSSFEDDAGGMPTWRKVLIAAAVLLGLAGIIWSVSYLLIFMRMKTMQ